MRDHNSIGQVEMMLDDDDNLSIEDEIEKERRVFQNRRSGVSILQTYNLLEDMDFRRWWWYFCLCVLIQRIVNNLSTNQRVCEGNVVVEKIGLWSYDSTFLQSHLRVEHLVLIKLLLADLHIGYWLLVHLRDSLCNSPDLSRYQERLFECHGLVGNFHLVVFDGEFYFGGN